jgi:hypothetical protein
MLDPATDELSRLEAVASSITLPSVETELAAAEDGKRHRVRVACALGLRRKTMTAVAGRGVPLT